MSYAGLVLIGASEAAQIVGVSRQRLWVLVATDPDCPAPIWRGQRSAVWSRDAIAAYTEARKRR